MFSSWTKAQWGLIAVIALVRVGAIELCAAGATNPRPNILILVADDLGYADLGAQGCTDIPPPQLDSIAKNGIRFTQGYVTAPVCSASRAGLITGRYQTRFGHEFNHALADRSPDGVGLPLDEKTAAQWFKEAGFVTGHVGKWHLGNPEFAHYTPNARGFDESVHFPGANKLPPLSFNRNRVPGKADDRYVDEAIGREAVSFIERHRTAPWFLFVAFLTPHQPLQTPPGTEGAFASITDPTRRQCAVMVSLLDGSVGRILKALHDTRQEEHTLIAFLSDNGAPPRNGSRNWPLRGGKGTTWEGGIREPFLLQWKGVLPAGRVENTPVISLDLLPTALAAAGIAVPSTARLDGVNLLPFLSGSQSKPPHSTLFWRYGDQMAVRRGQWKLSRALDSTIAPPTLKTGLFDLSNDAAETIDLSESYPEVLRALQSEWAAWNSLNVKALWNQSLRGSSVGDRSAPSPIQKTKKEDSSR